MSPQDTPTLLALASPPYQPPSTPLLYHPLPSTHRLLPNHGRGELAKLVDLLREVGKACGGYLPAMKDCQAICEILREDVRRRLARRCAILRTLPPRSLHFSTTYCPPMTTSASTRTPLLHPLSTHATSHSNSRGTSFVSGSDRHIPQFCLLTYFQPSSSPTTRPLKYVVYPLFYSVTQIWLLGESCVFHISVCSTLQYPHQVSLVCQCFPVFHLFFSFFL